MLERCGCVMVFCEFERYACLPAGEKVATVTLVLHHAKDFEIKTFAHVLTDF